MMASSERRMREIRTSGATSGDWKRSLIATAPVSDSTKPSRTNSECHAIKEYIKYAASTGTINDAVRMQRWRDFEAASCKSPSGWDK